MYVIYSVRAKLRQELKSEFYRKLTDGTIMQQEPDGEEIVDSMKRAVITSQDNVEWTEMCYCSPPLKHERQTVYDKYFVDLETEPADAYKQYFGKPLMDYLSQTIRDNTSERQL